MHQDDTYTTQATNDKTEAAPVDAASEAKIDTAGVDTTEAAATGKADGMAEVGASDDAAAGMATAVNPDDAQPGDPDSQYDQHAKFLLGHKIILAHILAALIEKFHGMEPKDILPYIEGDIHIGRVPIDPGKTNTGHRRYRSTKR